MTSAPESRPQPPEPRYHWYHKLAGIFYAIFCFQVGVYLLVFPWIPQWDRNYLATLLPWEGLWKSYYLRGAVSGLGLFNIYLSFVAAFQLRKFSGPEE